MRNEDQKSVTVGSKSYDALWAEFARGDAQPQPKGTITVSQYCARFGVTDTPARRKLARLRSVAVTIRTPAGPRLTRCYFLPERKRAA